MLNVAPFQARTVPSPPSPQAASPAGQAASWRINGHPAKIVVWTHEEWIGLAEQPRDAQFFPCGVWCALRLE
jgi:hypothetical protein